MEVKTNNVKDSTEPWSSTAVATKPMNSKARGEEEESFLVLVHRSICLPEKEWRGTEARLDPSEGENICEASSNFNGDNKTMCSSGLRIRKLEQNIEK